MICGSWGTVDELVGAVLRLDPGERAGFLYKVEVAEAEESFLRARASLPAPERCPRCGSPRIVICLNISDRERSVLGGQRHLPSGLPVAR